jgi:hypothetical protein
MQAAIEGLLRTPFQTKEGQISYPWAKWFQEQELKTRQALTILGQIQASTKIQGRTEGIGTTLTNLNPDGSVNSLDNVHDGTNYQRPLATALTAGQVDLGKAGVVGQVTSAKIGDKQVLSSKIIQNVMGNYSNNATVDSIDNGVNATVRVYGPGGPGTSWHQFIGATIGPEIPAFSGTAAYGTDFNVYLDAANSYHITPNGSETLPDGIQFSGSLHTVSAGGGGGILGGGGPGGGGGGGGTGRFK